MAKELAELGLKCRAHDSGPMCLRITLFYLFVRLLGQENTFEAFTECINKRVAIKNYPV